MVSHSKKQSNIDAHNPHNDFYLRESESNQNSNSNFNSNSNKFKGTRYVGGSKLEEIIGSDSADDSNIALDPNADEVTNTFFNPNDELHFDIPNYDKYAEQFEKEQTIQNDLKQAIQEEQLAKQGELTYGELTNGNTHDAEQQKQTKNYNFKTPYEMNDQTKKIVDALPTRTDLMDKKIVKSRKAQNDPFTSNLQKETFFKNKAIEELLFSSPGDKTKTIDIGPTPLNAELAKERNLRLPTSKKEEPMNVGTPVLDLKVYKENPAQSQYNTSNGLNIPGVKQINPLRAQIPMYMPTKINPAIKNLFVPTQAMSFGPNYEIPIQQVFNITQPSPTGTGHELMSRIYEDILPGKNVEMSWNTLGERLTIYEYLRQILIRSHDGEEISVDGTGSHSLLSYLSLMDLNPNYFSKISSNPYKNLPIGLLVYKSAYPIRMHPITDNVVPSPNAVKLNIRIYSLSIAEFISWYARDKISYKYDCWRELGYYEFVREEIIKPKMCPNFVTMFAYYMCANRKIDFFKLKSYSVTQKKKITNEFKRYLKLKGTFTDINDILKGDSGAAGQNTTNTDNSSLVDKLPDELDPSLQEYSGNCLIILTEAPTHNIYSWSSRLYEKLGVVNKMISHGYHPDEVWYSILFQIIAGLYTMYIKGIYLREMTMQDNIYITDLKSNGNIIGYWKYIIDGVPFYVPNYGYLVLIDTNYKDIIVDKTIMKQKREYKFCTNDLFDENYDMAELRNLIYDNYRKIITTNAFTKDYTMIGVTRPPEKILKFIAKIMQYEENEGKANKNLGHSLINNFTFYLNNRVGTYLKTIEAQSVRSERYMNFKKGMLCVELVDDDVQKWCLYDCVNNDGTSYIFTKVNPTDKAIIRKVIRTEHIREFSPVEVIEQTYKGDDKKLSEENLLETYYISNDTI
jgi:hypothetical protein